MAVRVAGPDTASNTFQPKEENMPASATVPRSAGNGAALVVVVLDAAISAWQSIAARFRG
ncbi:hypothetical protein NCCP691_03540 [Noviherbaspirillum aridicola]|uniref:Uncharacterized protein n=1 Tax=Noviherbaspirillum aridicola TaxID=2849687 RepID=A0ABQ4PZL6_9BURK|nr:hypothetical protein NCCP691_03540 [Noviherbaspirillum aridicola]